MLSYLESHDHAPHRPGRIPRPSDRWQGVRNLPLGNCGYRKLPARPAQTHSFPRRSLLLVIRLTEFSLVRCKEIPTLITFVAMHDQSTSPSSKEVFEFSFILLSRSEEEQLGLRVTPKVRGKV